MVLLALLGIAIGVLLVFCLVLVGLVETPWPVLLVGLLAALYSLQRVLVTNQGGISSANLADFDLQEHPSSHVSTNGQQTEEEPDPASDDGEVLTYRGIRYRVAKPHTNENHGSETLVEGIYRGQHWQRWQYSADETQTPEPKASEMTYRGHKVVKSDPET